MSWFKSGVILTPVCYTVSAFVLFSIWLPVVCHYYVPDVAISQEIIDKARQVPDDSVLEELDFFFTEHRGHRQIIARAERVVIGDIAFLGIPSKKFSMPFDFHQIDKAPERLQYVLALFSIPNLLLDAYELTGREFF